MALRGPYLLMQLLHLFKQFFLYFLHLFKEFSYRILHLFKMLNYDIIIFSACQFKNYREGNFVQNGKSGLEMDEVDGKRGGIRRGREVKRRGRIW